MKSANEYQVGGDHYQTECGVQHWDVVYLIFNGDYLLGAASKYMARVGKKGNVAKAVEDIAKAIHYLEKKRELLIQDMKEEDERCGATYHYVDQD